MPNLTLALALLLGVGMLAAKVAQLLRLPSVTGYILAGLALGPSGFGLVSAEGLGQQLNHFTQMALMLIAFGIGEHIELRRLGGMARQVVGIGLMQSLTTCLVVTLAVLAVAWFTVAAALPGDDLLILALLLGAVAMTTSPAAVLVVVREQFARGPLTATLLGVVAMGDGVAIVCFGMVLSVALQLAGGESAAYASALLGGLREISLSLVCGALTGLILDLVLRKLHRGGEILTAGLAILLLCGELTRWLHLSPLLAGMAAGCALINRSERDVRLFRALNAFEPPILVLFFTLAGGHLDLAALRAAGWIGLSYVLCRVAGKYAGCWLGARLSGAPALVRNHLGLALTPQAGVAIGLLLLISEAPGLARFSEIIIPVVLAGVVVSEVVGPLLVRRTVLRFGECHPLDDDTGLRGGPLPPTPTSAVHRAGLATGLPQPLRPAGRPEGVVAFGASREATVRGLARVATFLAHHHHALPLAIRALGKHTLRPGDTELAALFQAEQEEVQALGYPLRSEAVLDDGASGLVAATEYNAAHALVLGFPTHISPLLPHRLIDRVCRNVLCPVVLLRQVGDFRCDRVLVPYIHAEELEGVRELLEALATVVHPRLTFLHLLNSDSNEEEQERARDEQARWLYARFLDARVRQRIEASDCRTESIRRELYRHDLIVMAGRRQSPLTLALSGSLGLAVARACHCNLLLVIPPGTG
ncbi:MAG: hypothetical protein BWK76_04565 [Desulfobulbaceae bacterium A2]|nr:MAG: hypothetical protein BWK76_04565 [Desulfobulbaceae bacterium A2]